MIISVFVRVENILGKGEIACMSNFSFSHNVSKRLLFQTHQKVSLCGNVLTHWVSSGFYTPNKGTVGNNSVHAFEAILAAPLFRTLSIAATKCFFFSGFSRLAEHIMLRVSYCDQSLSGVHPSMCLPVCEQFNKKCSPLKPAKRFQ